MQPLPKNNIKTAFFREGHHYSLSDLMKSFSLDREKTKKDISTLKKYSVLKTVRKNKPEYSDLSDQDIIVGEIPDDSDEFVYLFTFVGVILLEDVVLFCYPKYIDKYNNDNDRDDLFQECQNIIKVIEKYNQKEQLVYLYDGDTGNKQFNRLEISLHIILDYFENDLYSNQHDIIELNGDGEILWDKTINESFAFIKNNTPYYLDIYTRDNTENDLDYIRRLHGAIISECSRNLDKGRLLDLFDLPKVELTDQSLDDFGDTDYIKYRLECELKNQFVTKKQNLLKTLYTYISEQHSNMSDVSFSLYGTNAFNLVWEKACADVFNDVKNVSIMQLKNINKLDKNINKHNDNSTLCDLIEKARWSINNDVFDSDKTLEPDIISIHNNTFFILDGKYYILSENKPGIQDVVKQFAYQKAFTEFVSEYKFDKIGNAFLFPKLLSECDNKEQPIECVGAVQFDLMQSYGFKLLAPIQVIKLDPDYIFKKYLNGHLCEDKLYDVQEINYTYLNKSNESLILNQQYEPVMVGFIRTDYFNKINERCQNGKDEFLFYFYNTQKSDFKQYYINPELFDCTKFIGRSDTDKVIVGDIKNEVQILTAKKLQERLLDYDIEKKEFGASSYYCVAVKSVKIIPKSEKQHILSAVEQKEKEITSQYIISNYTPWVYLNCPHNLGQFMQQPH
ncbi:MAG: LlaJI family restriction endonuclease [Spirochaetales bacterium]|nr:LlaJI family restriction endonuclease [Spirochaetales bacterium]